MSQESKKCSEDDCGRDHYGRGFCKKHYMSDWRKGRVFTKVCPEPGCGRNTQGGRLCASHYRRERNGDPLDLPIRRYGQEVCDKPGCGEPHESWGFCKKHYNEAKYDPDADHADNNLRHKYGITREERQQLVDAQGGLCGICGEPPRNGQKLAVDHDHSHCGGYTKGCRVCVRGMLCFGCNTHLGWVERLGLDIDIEYLKNPPAHRVLTNRVPKKRKRQKPFKEEKALLKELGLS